ncbi:MAG: PAS domain-containing sensor histidine kinase [Burkholderiales bacterium]|nr:PAS domain-containing sensor histidine kinase [Burkholderiales bacterium]
MESLEAYRRGTVRVPDLPDDTRTDDQALYKALVASLSEMGEGLMIIENRRFSFVNEAICLMTGRSAEELLGWPSFIFAFMTDERGRIMDNHLRRLSGEAFLPCYETAFEHRDGHRVEVEISVAFLHTTLRAGVVITVRDITQRKLAQEEIRRKNHDLQVLSASLEQKVLERTAELEKANRELIRLNQVKSDFISIVSHELRTPLTSIKSFAEILLDDADKQDIGIRKRYLSIINSESDRLSRLITDVLDLQKIDAGKMVWNDEILDLCEIAQSTVELFTPAFRDKGLSLSLSIDDPHMAIYAESDKIRQVFGNILSNALKFSDAGEVKVELKRLTDTPSGQPIIEMSITDTGIGIPPEEVERVFERFYQVDDSQKRKQGGTGLGLSICKDIIEHYAGTIKVNSALGKGSTFVILLPSVDQPRKKLGEVLVELGMLTHEELSTALNEQSKN